LWDGELARRSGHEYLELPGQDHGLEVDDTLASIETLREVMVAVEAYVAKLG
jgi:hypothetical protein